jgi:hypothetical protein
MNQSRTTIQIRIAFACLAAILMFAWGANIAHADEDTGASISIAPNGQIIVKGATVTGVYGNVITAETVWGPMRLYWTIQTTGSTRFAPDVGSEHALSRIEIGHTVGFSGTVSSSNGKPIVLATAVKDAELIQESVSIVGTVAAIDSEARSFVLRSADQEISVFAGQGMLMTRNGENASIEDLVVGDSGKATGSLDIASGTLTAARIWAKAEEAVPLVEEAPQENVFSSIITWLKGSRGILTVRDR